MSAAALQFFSDVGTALKSTKSLNHQNFEFFGLVPKSPTHTGLICVKTPMISQPFDCEIPELPLPFLINDILTKVPESRSIQGLTVWLLYGVSADGLRALFNN
jgi:hypothetical protein